MGTSKLSLLLLPICSALVVQPTIVLAKPADLAAVAQLQLDTFDPAPPPAPPSNPLQALLFGGGRESAASREGRSQRLTEELGERVAKGSDIYLAMGRLGESDSAVDLLGTVDLSEQELLSPFHSISEGLYISSMAVAAEARRLGIGRRLLEAAEERAVARGAECLWLFVEASNVGAVSLYESSGYRRQADTPRHAAFAAALELRQNEPILLRKPMPVA